MTLPPRPERADPGPSGRAAPRRGAVLPNARQQEKQPGGSLRGEEVRHGMEEHPNEDPSYAPDPVPVLPEPRYLEGDRPVVRRKAVLNEPAEA